MSIKPIRYDTCLPYLPDDRFTDTDKRVLVLTNPAVGRPLMDEDPNFRQSVFDHVKKVAVAAQKDSKESFTNPLMIYCALPTIESPSSLASLEMRTVASFVARALGRFDRHDVLVEVNNNGLKRPLEECRNWARLTLGSSILIVPPADISEIIPRVTSIGRGIGFARKVDGWCCIHEQI